MRPLYHPPAEEISVQGILYALTDPVRVKILADLVMGNCAASCSNFLTMGKIKLPKSTLSQHFKILREAGLIRSEKRGVMLYNTPRCNELKKNFGPLIDAILTAYIKESKKKR